MAKALQVSSLQAVKDQVVFQFGSYSLL
jgi:hypothetical protein